jgi:hypothetical protein
MNSQSVAYAVAPGPSLSPLLLLLLLLPGGQMAGWAGGPGLVQGTAAALQRTMTPLLSPLLLLLQQGCQ